LRTIKELKLGVFSLQTESDKELLAEEGGIHIGIGKNSQ
jgi:hypothetical protein